MTEEVKKILNNFIKIVKKPTYTKETYDGNLATLFKTYTLETSEVETLLNYIINLQKENQSLKEKLNCKEYFSSTMPENTEFVILTKENYDKQQKDLALENIILKSRNEKAIEYIKNDLQISVLPNNQIINGIEVVKRINKIANILQGGDE